MGNQAPVGSVLQAFSQVGDFELITVSYDPIESFSFLTQPPGGLETFSSGLKPLTLSSGGGITHGAVFGFSFRILIRFDIFSEPAFVDSIFDLRIFLVSDDGLTDLFAFKKLLLTMEGICRSDAFEPGVFFTRTVTILTAHSDSIIGPLSEPATKLRFKLTHFQSAIGMVGTITGDIRMATAFEPTSPSAIYIPVS